MFDYDVFLSFASGDEKNVRPVWQKLSLNGLRVFWSDAALKQRLGDSWSQAIETALERSRHFVLMASALSMSSEWVEREYRAFYNHCYHTGVRRLIPVLMGNYKISQLPLLLRSLQAVPFDDTTAEQIVKLVGGTNIEQLKKELILKERENEKLLSRLETAEIDKDQLKQQANLIKRLNTENGRLSRQVARLTLELDSIRQNQAIPVQSASSPAAGASSLPTIEAVLHQVKAPIVGTYYDAPSPGHPPFVRVGDKVVAGQVLCIIEAMKLMNEIESDIAGEVVQVLLANGAPVEYAQPMFLIRPTRF